MAQVPRKTGALGLVTGLWADWFTLLLGWSGRPPVFTNIYQNDINGGHMSHISNVYIYILNDINDGHMVHMIIYTIIKYIYIYIYQRYLSHSSMLGE